MTLWPTDDSRFLSALARVRPDDARLDAASADRRFIDDVLGRVVWNVLIEPGDRVAGTVIRSLGPARAALLVMNQQSPGALVEAMRGELDADEVEEALRRWGPRARWEDVIRSLDSAARCGVRLLVPDDGDWPEGFDLLDESAPVLLWFRGDSALLRRPGVAVVGARAATGYGEHVAMELAAALSARDVVVISGGAYGIDGMAHRATLASDGATIAVLAGGLDRLYPSGHEALLTRVAEQGLLISEAPCGSAPTKWRFLQRNRLIAALGAATVVVEAGRRSGALNTATHALAAGRPVGLVPGPVTSAASAGCHAFLRDYPTTLVAGAPDVMRLAFGNDGVLDFSAVLDDDPAYGVRSRRDALETRVLDALRPRRGMTAEEVARSIGEGVVRMRSTLGALELEGAVARGADGLWRKSTNSVNISAKS